MKSFLQIATKKRQQRREKVSRRRIWLELQRALQLRVRADQIPIKNAVDFTEVTMRFSIFFVERDSFERRFFGLRIRIERLDVNARQKIPDLGDSSPSAGES